MRSVRMILLCSFIFLLMTSGSVFAAAARGIVASDPANGTVIIRDGQEIPCTLGVLLYEDDIVQGSHISDLSIEWHPYASASVLGATQLKVVFNPPSSLDLGLQKFKEFFGFVDGEVQAQYAATRGGISSLGFIFPLPGFSATLLPGQTVDFLWGDQNVGKLIIEDKNKQIVWQQSALHESVEATPEAMGLKKGVDYTWRIEGFHDKYILHVLDQEVASSIMANLAELDQQYQNDTQRKIMKATYLQFISENSRGRIDLYWLGEQLLKTADAGDDVHSKEQIKHLRERMMSHLDSQR